MSATCDICTHDFISRDVPPTRVRAEALQAVLNSEQPDGSWVAVFCVEHGGIVDWACVQQGPIDRFLRRTYGTADLPLLGVGSGYLVRSYHQERDPTYWERKRAQRECADDYAALARYLRKRGAP